MRATSYIDIDLDAISDNVKRLCEISGKAMMAIIKANAYGLVDHIIAKHLEEEGVYFFGVSSILEAVSLRDHGIKAEILVLGYVDLEDIKTAIDDDIQVTIVSPDYAKTIATNDIKGLRVHIAVDTGMHRLGLWPEEIEETMALLEGRGAKVEGIFTHYAKSGDDKDFTDLQYDRFLKVLEDLDRDFPYIHTANTDGALTLADGVSSFVRCGIGIFGYSSFEDVLRPSVSLYSTVTNTRYIKKGEGIGYGQVDHLEEDAYILTVAIGYADGIIRKNRGRKVYIDGHYCPIFGNVCMDQLMVKSDVYIAPGTKVEIFGDHISIYDMAKDLETIPYEILTSMSDRLERRYHKGGRIVGVHDPRFAPEKHENA